MPLDSEFTENSKNQMSGFITHSQMTQRSKSNTVLEVAIVLLIETTLHGLRGLFNKAKRGKIIAAARNEYNKNSTHTAG